jgi:DNA segregation ATPase FtsK/SpoIIIE-like protein
LISDIQSTARKSGFTCPWQLYRHRMWQRLACFIQRKPGIGYNKAARLVEQMEDEGVVTRANHVGKREILVEER